MSTNSTTAATSLYARLISGRRKPWITTVLGLALVVAPIGAAYVDGVLPEYFALGYWQLALLPAAVILYILIVAPVMAHMEEGVVKAYRPMIQLGDEAFDHLVREASRLSRAGEAVSILAGAAFGLWVGLSWMAGEGASWLWSYLAGAVSLMFGLLVWTIYAIVAGTRLTSVLHRQPLQFDILDTRPFEPVGRQSLISAVVFVGGIVIGMVFGVGRSGILDWQNWLLLLLLFLVPVVMFFLNMRGTHSVLATEKKRVLDVVQAQIGAACRKLSEQMAAGDSTGRLGAEINALAVYEERLLQARTWPYNTAMLRTLFVSVIVPGGVALARAVYDMFFP